MLDLNGRIVQLFVKKIIFFAPSALKGTNVLGSGLLVSHTYQWGASVVHLLKVHATRKREFLIPGFEFVAYPTTWRLPGSMLFHSSEDLVNHGGGATSRSWTPPQLTVGRRPLGGGGVGGEGFREGRRGGLFPRFPGFPGGGGVGHLRTVGYAAQV